MSVYYNDLDPYCCRVLEKNIRLGHLPKGYVDGRDIRDVRAADLVGYQHIHLFAGIGGFPYGMHCAGYPLSLRTITAGFPCQPFSVAGKRQGEQDERYLWHEVTRIVRTVQPDYLLLENVPGLLSMDRGRVFGNILADLAEVGYDATWTSLRASDFGAPHQRERIFIVAYPNGRNGYRWAKSHDRGSGRTALGSPTLAYSHISNGKTRRTDRVGTGEPARTSPCPCRTMDNAESKTERRLPIRTGTKNARSECTSQDVADASEQGLPQWGYIRLTTSTEEDGTGMESQPQRCSDVEHANGQRCQECDVATIAGGQEQHSGIVSTIPLSGQLERELCRDDDGLSAGLDRHRWPAGPGQPQHDYEPLRVVTEKQPHRAARLKALGNAIVPQCVTYVTQCIMAYELKKMEGAAA